MLGALTEPLEPVPTLQTSFEVNVSVLDSIRTGYASDKWCCNLISSAASFPSFCQADELWFLDERLVVPQLSHTQELLFHLAHDSLGHLGANKLYASLQNSFY